MHTQDASPDISRTQSARLMLRDARARALNLLTMGLTALVLAIVTIGGIAGPANAQVVVEDSAGSVVAAYAPSMAERAAFGFQDLTGQSIVNVDNCIPGVDPDCGEDNPPPDSICSQINQWGNTDKGTLPVHRWTDATSSLHSRLGAKFTDDIYQKLARNGMAQSYLSVGNAAWSTSVTMTESANQFCVGDSIGATVDKGMGAVARAIFFDAWIGVIVLVGAAVAIIYRAARSGMPSLGAVGRLLGVTGLVVVMMNGAANSDGATGHYGTMSPGWMMNKVNSVMASTSGALSKGLLDGMDAIDAGGTPPAGEQYANEYSSHCYNYMDQLVEHYEAQHVMADIKGMTAAPLALNSVWTESALQSYIGSQFGSGNAYGQASFCHQLEFNAQTSSAEHAYFTLAAIQDADAPASAEEQAAMIAALAAPGSPAYNGVFNPTDNNREDNIGAFWASCVTNNGTSWSVALGWENVGEGKIEDSDCAEAYGASGDYDWGGSPFNWKNRDHILEDTSASAATVPAFSNAGNAFHPRQFLENYQGWVASDGMVAAIVHALTAIILFVLFGAISLFILIAKMALVVLAATVVLVGIADMLFGRTSSRLVKFFKLLVGMAIITWGSSFFLSFLAVMTKIINDMGKAMDLNVIGAIVWAGLAPVLAVLLLKFVFSKVLKMPDPLSVSGAKNYMGSAGMIGGTAVDRAISAPTRMSQGAWGRLTGSPATAGAGASAIGGSTSRGSLGAHSAGRGRADSMTPETDLGTVGQGGAQAAAPAERRAAGSVAGRDSGSLQETAAENAAGAGAGAGAAVATAKARRPRYGRDGDAMPAELAGAWKKTGAGRDVEHARMVREGRTMEREALGGRHQVRKVEKQMERAAVAGRRSEMGMVGRNADRVSSAAGKTLRGVTSGRATAATVGAAGLAAVAGASIAPALMVAGMGMGAVALARHRNAHKSGTHSARRAARNQRALQTFINERNRQLGDDIPKEEAEARDLPIGNQTGADQDLDDRQPTTDSHTGTDDTGALQDGSDAPRDAQGQESSQGSSAGPAGEQATGHTDQTDPDGSHGQDGMRDGDDEDEEDGGGAGDGDHRGPQGPEDPRPGGPANDQATGHTGQADPSGTYGQDGMRDGDEDDEDDGGTGGGDHDDPKGPGDPRTGGYTDGETEPQGEGAVPNQENAGTDQGKLPSQASTTGQVTSDNRPSDDTGQPTDAGSYEGGHSAPAPQGAPRPGGFTDEATAQDVPDGRPEPERQPTPVSQESPRSGGCADDSAPSGATVYTPDPEPATEPEVSPSQQQPVQDAGQGEPAAPASSEQPPVQPDSQVETPATERESSQGEKTSGLGRGQGGGDAPAAAPGPEGIRESDRQETPPTEFEEVTRTYTNAPPAAPTRTPEMFTDRGEN
ncbi:hypothetical protein [Ornithinimicrobium murale]|uniref:hypothetical protein n=1 Tax=Ornithinimicrobium murale TaxID=1050153 RepID=UPI000E0CC033|nr:hypothetical protein [Ornithinimicrobium murale]